MTPKCMRQYPIPEALKGKVLARVKEWEEKGWVRELVGERNLWNTPLMAAAKKSGGKIDTNDIRLCMDLRGVNDQTQVEEYILPLASDMFAKLRGAKLFTELDLSAAFHQIRVEEETSKILGFTAPDGRQMVWERMPFGPKNACTHFQKIAERATVECREFLVNYVDNFLIASETVEEHIDRVSRVIDCLTKAGFKLNPKKCKVGYTRIQFMGHMLDGESRVIDRYKIDLFTNLERPKSGKQVESLLGFANFLRDFIPQYADIAAPLDKLRKLKGLEGHWNDEHEKAFQRLKEVIKEAPVLSQPD